MGLWRSIRKNAALLTVSSLVMQSLSMLWQVWLAAHIGPAGIGLFQLIGSVGFLFITLAVSGIRFSVTRLLAEELGDQPVPRLDRGVVDRLNESMAEAAALYESASP